MYPFKLLLNRVAWTIGVPLFYTHADLYLTLCCLYIPSTLCLTRRFVFTLYMPDGFLIWKELVIWLIVRAFKFL